MPEPSFEFRAKPEPVAGFDVAGSVADPYAGYPCVACKIIPNYAWALEPPLVREAMILCGACSTDLISYCLSMGATPDPEGSAGALRDYLVSRWLRLVLS